MHIGGTVVYYGVGSGTALVTATDRATNATVRAFTVARDATPPQVWLDAPASVVTGPITVTWGAADAQSGVAYYDLDVSIYCGLWQRVLTRTTTTTYYRQTNQPANYYTFRVTATDHVPNAASAFARTSIPRVMKYYLGGGVRRGGVLYYLHTDHLGSASLTTDASGNKLGELRYKPYGETRYIWGAMRTDRRFTGQVEDAAIGLYFYNARYYDPLLACFLSADTIVPGAADSAGGGAATLGYSEQTRLTSLTVGFHETQFLDILNTENREPLQYGPPALWDGKVRQEHVAPMGPANPQALNRYAYCLGNPLRYVDPSGHDSGGDQDIGYDYLYDTAGNPVLDANGNHIYRLWNYGSEIYIAGDCPDLAKFFLYAGLHAQAKADMQKAGMDIVIGVPVFACGVILTIAGGASEAPFLGLNIPGWVVVAAGVGVTLGGVYEIGSGVGDLITAMGDESKQYRNATDIFFWMRGSQYDVTAAYLLIFHIREV